MSAQPPYHDAHIWAYWLDLARTRASGMSSPQPLGYGDIRDFRDVRPDIFINGRIAQLLIRIDVLFRRQWAEFQNKSEEDQDA
ncbi:MAG: hypothetical protein AAGC77_06490 [Pseudomonadota bacterium]